MTRAYVFDLDGTLLDTEIVWVEATHDYLLAKGHDVPREFAMSIVYGRSWTDVYADIVDAFPELDMGLLTMQAELDAFFYKVRGRADVRIPGSVALLRRLAKTAPCCIVSGSPRQHIADAVDIMDAAGEVAFYLGAEDYPFGKPHPSGFLMAADRFGVKPANCVVFEDSAVGVAAGKAAGMKVVALALPLHPKQDVAAADLILDDLAKFDPKVFDPA
ncbi:MAG: HAD family hydrolase [Kiritimatiellia bacterium]|jgi:HAD superfamily hydrolase (TIGR01509 family)